MFDERKTRSVRKTTHDERQENERTLGSIGGEKADAAGRDVDSFLSSNTES